MMMHPVFFFSTCSYSDLTKIMLDRTLLKMVVDAFVARWKKDDNPDDFGQKMYGSDNIQSIEIIQTILGNAGRLIIVHPTMLKEEYVKDESDEVMKTLMESGETYNVSISNCAVN